MTTTWPSPAPDSRSSRPSSELSKSARGRRAWRFPPGRRLVGSEPEGSDPPISREPALVAVPDNVINCGEDAPLSVMESVALKVPAAVGTNPTAVMQSAFGARVGTACGQEGEVGRIGAPNRHGRQVESRGPVFVRIRDMAVDVAPALVVGKVRVVALSFTIGAAAPVPLKAIVCGEPLALSVTLIVAVRAAAVAGLNPA